MSDFSYDFSWAGGESTPKLHRSFEREEKEPNAAVDTGQEHGACYLCNRQTNIVIVFSPYPREKATDPEVKPYRIRMCGWCAIAHKVVPKPVT